MNKNKRFVLAVNTFSRKQYLENLLNTWRETIGDENEWLLIVADDGSSDGSLEYLNTYDFENKHIIKSNANGIHYNVNQIIKFLSDADFSVCFRCDNDVYFKKEGWEYKYEETIQQTGYDHLVHFDPAFRDWRSGRKSSHRLTPHNKYLEFHTGVGACSCMGCFYTITPRIIKTVGYFDTKTYGLNGQGHQNFTYRCCKAGFNVQNKMFDLKDNKEYISMVIENYVSTGQQDVKRAEAMKKVKSKTGRVNPDRQKDIYMPYNETGKNYYEY